jgi:phage internal scaffolding protein
MFSRSEAKPVLTEVGTELLTKQSFRDECDINTIMKRFANTGEIHHLNEGSPQFLDLPDAEDYQASLERVRAAEQAFSALPSAVRERYENSPANLLEALGQEGERQFLIDQGIIEAPPAKAGAPPAEADGVS